jgi:hypothetical protein
LQIVDSLALKGPHVSDCDTHPLVSHLL